MKTTLFIKQIVITFIVCLAFSLSTAVYAHSDEVNISMMNNVKTFEELDNSYSENVYASYARTTVQEKKAKERYLGLKAQDIIICALLFGGYVFARRSVNSRKSNF